MSVSSSGRSSPLVQLALRSVLGTPAWGLPACALPRDVPHPPWLPLQAHAGAHRQHVSTKANATQPRVCGSSDARERQASAPVPPAAAVSHAAHAWRLHGTAGMLQVLPWGHAAARAHMRRSFASDAKSAAVSRLSRAARHRTQKAVARPPAGGWKRSRCDTGSAIPPGKDSGMDAHSRQVNADRAMCGFGL